MITEDYISYDIAKLLRDKGFDEQTVRCYNLRKELCICQCRGNETINSTPNYLIAAPTLQMAMKWLREVYKLAINVEFQIDCPTWKWRIYRIEPLKGKYTNFKHYNTYEEACESAIKYALENLI